MINQKGGVGKTTTVLNLGVALSMQGNSVILIDLDSQGSLSICYGIDINTKPYGIVDLLQAIVDDHELQNIGEYTWCSNHVDVISATQELAALETSLINVMSREYMLKYVLEEITKGYDYIL